MAPDSSRRSSAWSRLPLSLASAGIAITALFTWATGVNVTAAQAPASPPPPQPATTRSEAQEPAPTFRAATSAVVLDVVVRDKKGRTITDLRQNEVQVLEDGKPVELQAFGLVSGTSPLVTAREAATGQPDPLRRVTLITLVFETLTQNGRDLARRAALQFAARELPAGQWVSIYRLDQRLWHAQAFTRSPAEIRAGILAATHAGGRETVMDTVATGRSTTGPPPVAAAEVGGRAPGAGVGGAADQVAIGANAADAAVNAVLERVALMVEKADIDQRGQSTLFPLMALVKAQGSLEGRKALVLFSEGFVVPPNLEEVFRATVSEANRANVSVYAVDARGLDSARSLEGARTALDSSARNSQRQMMTRGNEPVTVEDVMNAETAEGALHKDLQGTLQMLAEETGGILVANSNNLAERLDRVSADLDAYYQLAYTPATTTYDGRFRKIEVRVARRGVDVQSRSGYFALPPTDGAPLLPYELPMLAAASATPLPTPFRVGATTFRFGVTPRGVQHTVLVEVPLDQLTFEEDRREKKYALRFTVMALVRNEKDEIIERLSDSFPLEGPLERVEALKRGRLVFKRQVWLAPGRYSVLAVARDQTTERSSVHSMTVVVPDATASVPLVSSLAVIRRVEPASEQPDAVEDPFRTDQLRIVPSLDTPISRATNPQVSAYVVVYPDRGRVPSLTFEFQRGGAVIGRSAAELPAPDRDGRIKYVASFPTKIFEPGTYVLRAVATLDGRTNSSDVSFTIVP
ncbi:VWFA-related Acidobacterial domain protein [Luteitalea pratensis]|uniref:VWFA-related Acidobacterial domain protein n=1 Tax=Luteitalea pratensis TaxID=1855912 RepID=A0A143PUA9_LUTPR|nr:VWA domain-containing protein [Luteitalea pratensis]AMY12245.1 VWFA-related Acidobacterial domain protein [Luteitalea pratensis]